MKRLISALLVCMLLCAALTGCGSGREKADISSAACIADLTGATLGAQTGTFHREVLDQLDGITKKDYADFTDLLNALKSGAIDGYVAEEPTALEVCGKDSTLTYLPFVNNDTGFAATDDETGIAIAFKTGSEMTAQVNTILAGISAETRRALMAQIVAMSADPEQELDEAPVLSAPDADASNGVFRIAMECAYAPFNWTQTTQANGAVPIEGQNGGLRLRLGFAHSRRSVRRGGRHRRGHEPHGGAREGSRFHGLLL